MSHNIAAARYASDDTSAGALVFATMSDGTTQGRRADDDIDGGGMLAFLAGGGTIAPYVAPPPTQDDYAAAIQTHVDTAAASRGYGDGDALASYATSTIPAWSAEAMAFIAWRDAVWIYAYTELAKVQGGVRTQPTIAALIAELPLIEWPV